MLFCVVGLIVPTSGVFITIPSLFNLFFNLIELSIFAENRLIWLVRLENIKKWDEGFSVLGRYIYMY